MTRTSVCSMASVSLLLTSLGGLGCGSDSDGDLGSGGSSGSAGSAGSGGSTSRTLDSGSFTIPAAMVQAAQLGDMAFLNLLNIERNDVGFASGEGMTSHDITGIQTAVIG